MIQSWKHEFTFPTWAASGLSKTCKYSCLHILTLLSSQLLTVYISDITSSTRGMQSHLKGLRKPPGDYSSMEICQIVALVTEKEFRDAATSVRDRLLELEPDMSKSYQRSPNHTSRLFR